MNHDLHLKNLKEESKLLSKDAQLELKQLQTEITTLKEDSRQLSLLFSDDPGDVTKLLHYMGVAVGNYGTNPQYVESPDFENRMAVLTDFLDRVGSAGNYYENRFNNR